MGVSFDRVILVGQSYGSVPGNLLSMSYPNHVVGYVSAGHGVFDDPGAVDIQNIVLFPTNVYAFRFARVGPAISSRHRSLAVKASFGLSLES